MWYRYSQANNPIVWIDKDNQQYVLYIDRNGKQQKVPFDSAQKLGINPNNLPVTNNPNFVKKNISNWNFNDQSTSLTTNNPDSQSLFTPDFTRYQSQQGYNLMNQGYSLDQAKQIVNSQEFIQQYNASKNSSLGSQSNRNNPIVWIDKDNKQYVLYIDKNGQQQKEPFETAQQKLGINPNHLPTTNDPNFVKKNISNWNFNDQNTRLTANSPGYYSGKDKYSVEKTGYVSEPKSEPKIDTTNIAESNLNSAKADKTNKVHLVKNDKGDYEVWTNGQKTQRTFVNDTGQKNWSAEDMKSALKNSPPPATNKPNAAKNQSSAPAPKQTEPPQQKEAPKQPAAPQQKPK